MLIQTILNKCYKFKSFVYGKCKLDGKRLIVNIFPRKNNKAICSGCYKKASSYDKLKNRLYEFIPLWGMKIFFQYAKRRVNCKTCGVKVEKVPWADGKNTCTIAFMLVLSNWAKSLSWLETARRFKVSWGKVFRSIQYTVEWGLKSRVLDEIKSLGIDEIYWGVKNGYLTLIYQIDQGCKRLLWISKDRTEQSLQSFFSFFGERRSKLIKFVCSDMWKPYISVIKNKIPQAIHILDRFHIIQKINKAIDEVRANEHKKLIADGYEPILKKTRWCLLKRPENLTEKQDFKLRDLLKYNLKSVRAYLLKEDFDGLWTYVSPAWASKFIDKWTTRVMRSKIIPLKKIANTIRRHKSLILNWFKARGLVSTGAVEGLNNKAKVTMRKSYGFRTYKCVEIALYHALGALPEPELTHRFC